MKKKKKDEQAASNKACEMQVGLEIVPHNYNVRLTICICNFHKAQEARFAAVEEKVLMLQKQSDAIHRLLLLSEQRETEREKERQRQVEAQRNQQLTAQNSTQTTYSPNTWLSYFGLGA
jgi:hypothetical protein